MNEIIKKYKSGEITLEEANAQLEASGAGYSLKSLTDEELAAKRKREDKMGFFNDPEGQKKLTYPKELDKSKKPELAGMTVRQRTVHGLWDVEYDEVGYYKKAIKVKEG